MTAADVKNAIAGRNILVAVSGKSGCGNTSLSRMIADALDLKFINYTFRNLAVERNVSLEAIIEEAARNDEIDRTIDRRQVEMAAEGDCVLASRLAIWLKPDADLTVYLHAEPSVRISRIASREGWSIGATEAHTSMRDREDHRRYLELYGIDNDDWHFADLVLDAGKLSLEDELQAVLEAVARKIGD